MIKKICLGCGKKFEVNKCLFKRKFCSRDCYIKKNVKQSKKCLFCGGTFIGSHKNQIYCSNSCHQNMRKTNSKKEYICLNCGKTFLFFKKKKRFYCCVKCCGQHQIVGKNNIKCKKYYMPWNINLTKEIDIRLKRIGEKISKSMKGNIPWNRNKTAIEDNRILSGEQCFMWQNGKSFEPYGLEFNKDLKEQIRNRDYHICSHCGVLEEQTREKLNIHHIDYNKNNNNQNNLITLCRMCHSRTNSNRNFWERHFQNCMKIKIEV
jgi:hypothetical protein